MIIFKERTLSKTLRQVCDYLTNQCGHQYTWLGYRSWPNGQQPPDHNEQPFITSCSGRELAEYDGVTWYLINSAESLQFNDIDDFDDPQITKNPYLTAEDIKINEMFLGL